MRRAAVLCLLAGCNQFWDIDPVGLRDGGSTDGDGAMKPQIRLSLQVAQTLDTGYPDPDLEYAAITPAPGIQVGRIGEPLVGAPYDNANGTVTYPDELVGAKWRLVYTLGDGIPREVQWSPARGLGHIVEPLLGRRVRKDVPASSGYTITPVGSPAQHTLTRVFTTGVWTEGANAGTSPGATFTYDFNAKARPLSGDLGAPERMWSDLAVLADFRIDGPTQCRVTSGQATFLVPDLMVGALTAPSPQPAYSTILGQVMLGLGGPAPIHARMGTMLGSLVNGANAVRWEYGYVPSLAVFGFSKPVVEEIGAFALPSPRMLAFADCSSTQGSEVLVSPVFADSPELRERFPRVVHVEIVNARTVGALQLRSGFSAVVASSSDAFSSEFLVAAPSAIELRRGGAPIANLVDDPDGRVLPAGGEPVELTFQVEPQGTLAADYFDITLYDVSANTLNRQRIYTVTDRTLTIDPSLLVPNASYVLEIRAYRGRPNLSQADFAATAYPQYAATVFTRTFRMPP
jgi:hypothetical protein